MVTCPRCGHVDDGSSYLCPKCYGPLQAELKTSRRPQPQPADPSAGPGPTGPPTPTGYAPADGPTAENPYRAPAAWPVGRGPAGRPMGYLDPPTYLGWSIAVTVLCCIPFGIVAIVNAARVGTYLAAGDWDRATDASGKARMWAWLAGGFGLVAQTIYVYLHFSGTLTE